MTVIDDLTPVYFSLMRIGIQRIDGEVIAMADVNILNAMGEQVTVRNPSTTLTAAEKTALLAFITRELGMYATATGLTEWTE